MALVPWKFATVDDDAPQIGARDTDPRLRGLDHDVGAVFDRANKVAPCSCGIVSVI